MRSLDGKPVRVKPGCADRMNKALEVLGIKPLISQTEKTLTVDNIRVNCPRTYETMKSIDFDNKVRDALRKFCVAQGINIIAIQDEYDVVNKEIAEICPERPLAKYPFDNVSIKSIEDFLAKAKAVEEYCSNPEVRAKIERREAVNELFKNDWDEVIN